MKNHYQTLFYWSWVVSIEYWDAERQSVRISILNTNDSRLNLHLFVFRSVFVFLIIYYKLFFKKERKRLIISGVDSWRTVEIIVPPTIIVGNFTRYTHRFEHSDTLIFNCLSTCPHKQWIILRGYSFLYTSWRNVKLALTLPTDPRRSMGLYTIFLPAYWGVLTDVHNCISNARLYAQIVCKTCLSKTLIIKSL